MNARKKSLLILQFPKVVCLVPYYSPYTLTIFLRTYTHRSVCSQMTPQPTLQSIMKHTVTHCILQTWCGVDISKDLSWNTHTNRITANANRILGFLKGFLKRNIKTKHAGIRTAADATLVRPQVEYASPVWNANTQSYINKTEMIQRRAVCWVNNKYTYASNVASDIRHKSVTLV